MLDHYDGNLPPHDRRGFVHKRIGGAITGFIGGGFTGAAAGFIGGGGGGGGGRTPGARPPQVAIDNMIKAGIFNIPGLTGPEVAGRRRDLAGAGFLGAPIDAGPCPGPTNIRVNGVCVDPLRALPGGVPFLSAVNPGAGEAVMGRYGAALAPVMEERVHRDCLPGMVLGDDDLCYNRRDLKNSERKYPKGRAPLLTGGERNAITKAARAAAKITRTTKQLQKLGMIKKPSSRRAAPKPMRQIGPGGPSIINVE